MLKKTFFKLAKKLIVIFAIVVFSVVWQTSEAKAAGSAKCGSIKGDCKDGSATPIKQTLQGCSNWSCVGTDGTVDNCGVCVQIGNIITGKTGGATNAGSGNSNTTGNTKQIDGNLPACGTLYKCENSVPLNRRTVDGCSTWDCGFQAPDGTQEVVISDCNKCSTKKKKTTICGARYKCINGTPVYKRWETTKVKDAKGKDVNSRYYCYAWSCEISTVDSKGVKTVVSSEECKDCDNTCSNDSDCVDFCRSGSGGDSSCGYVIRGKVLYEKKSDATSYDQAYADHYTYNSSAASAGKGYDWGDKPYELKFATGMEFNCDNYISNPKPRCVDVMEIPTSESIWYNPTYVKRCICPELSGKSGFSYISADLEIYSKDDDQLAYWPNGLVAEFWNIWSGSGGKDGKTGFCKPGFYCHETVVNGVKQADCIKGECSTDTNDLSKCKGVLQCGKRFDPYSVGYDEGMVSYIERADPSCNCGLCGLKEAVITDCAFDEECSTWGEVKGSNPKYDGVVDPYCKCIPVDGGWSNDYDVIGSWNAVSGSKCEPRKQDKYDANDCVQPSERKDLKSCNKPTPNRCGKYCDKTKPYSKTIQEDRACKLKEGDWVLDYKTSALATVCGATVPCMLDSDVTTVYKCDLKCGAKTCSTPPGGDVAKVETGNDGIIRAYITETVSDTPCPDRPFECDAKPEPGTVWNTVSGYNQTCKVTRSKDSIGTLVGSWVPADSATEYNEESSTTSCRFVCDSNHKKKVNNDGSVTCAPKERDIPCDNLPICMVGYGAISNKCYAWYGPSSYHQVWNDSLTPPDWYKYYKTHYTVNHGEECGFICTANAKAKENIVNGEKKTTCEGAERNWPCLNSKEYEDNTGTLGTGMYLKNNSYTFKQKYNCCTGEYELVKKAMEYNGTDKGDECGYKCNEDNGYYWNEEKQRCMEMECPDKNCLGDLPEHTKWVSGPSFKTILDRNFHPAMCVPDCSPWVSGTPLGTNVFTASIYRYPNNTCCTYNCEHDYAWDNTFQPFGRCTNMKVIPCEPYDDAWFAERNMMPYTETAITQIYHTDDSDYDSTHGGALSVYEAGWWPTDNQYKYRETPASNNECIVKCKDDEDVDGDGTLDKYTLIDPPDNWQAGCQAIVDCNDEKGFYKTNKNDPKYVFGPTKYVFTGTVNSWYHNKKDDGLKIELDVCAWHCADGYVWDDIAGDCIIPDPCEPVRYEGGPREKDGTMTPRDNEGNLIPSPGDESGWYGTTLINGVCWFKDNLNNQQIRLAAGVYGDHNELYNTGNRGKIYLSEDDGNTWKSQKYNNKEFNEQWVAMHFTSDGETLLAGNYDLGNYNKELHTSLNAYQVFDKTWSEYQFPFDANTAGFDWQNISSKADGSKLYAVPLRNFIYKFPPPCKNCVYKSEDRGKTWSSDYKVAPNDTNNRLFVSVNGQKQLILGYGNSRVYRSDNEGKTWDVIFDDTTNYLWQWIEADKSFEHIAALGTNTYINVSQDGGKTWDWVTKFNPGDDSYTKLKWGAVKVSADGKYMAAFAMGDYVYTSRDYGKTWYKKDKLGTGNWWGMDASPDGSTIIVLAQGGGVVKISRDYGETWTEVLQRDNWHPVALSATRFCYNHSRVACVNYGGLYTWRQALKQKNCPAGSECQGICPEGWHIPTEEDFIRAGMQKSSLSTKYKKDGANTYKFDGLYAGLRMNNDDFVNAGNLGYWWSTGPSSMGESAKAYGINKASSVFSEIMYTKTTAAAVRCVKDSQ